VRGLSLIVPTTPWESRSERLRPLLVGLGEHVLDEPRGGRFAPAKLERALSA
jgi:hypothetical protein